MTEMTQARPAYGGGLLGYLKGTQSLSSAFWLVGVVPAVVLMLAGLAAVGARNYFEIIIAIKLCVLVTRLFAWISIFRCRNNTESKGFQVFVMVVMGIDIFQKFIFWPIFFIAISSRL